MPIIDGGWYHWSPGTDESAKIVITVRRSGQWIGVRFDHEYYREKHLPLIERRMGADLKYYTVDKGLSGASSDSPPAYVAMCHLLCDSLEGYNYAFAPHAPEIVSDIRNFTDQTPITQISEVVVENSAANEVRSHE